MSTLTVYPVPGTTVDGYVQRTNDGDTWNALVTGAGTGNDTASSEGTFIVMARATSGSNFWYLRRSIFCFDTSALTSGATISATVLSLYGASKGDDLVCTPNIDIYLATPAATNALANGDYTQIGSTSQTGSPISYASFSITGYNDFTFDATGRGNVSKTGISSFGARNQNRDVANSAPTGGTNFQNSQLYGYFSDAAGTSTDPKLVVTYTTVVGPANLKTYNTNLSANIKSINTNLIANVKSLNTNV